MPLILSPMTPSDTLSWTRIRHLAYLGPTHDTIHSINPIPESEIRLVAADRVRDLQKPNTFHWKIVDTDLPPSEDDDENAGGRVIAIGVWSMQNITNPAGYGEDVSAEKEQKPPYSPPGTRLDVLMSLLTPIRTAQLDIMGTSEPYFMLNGLVTHPEHRGRGAAGMLLEWGLEKADDEGLVTYLDCTEMGRPMYERRGWSLVREVVWDREKWGGEGKDWHGCMVRQPKGKKVIAI
ncbi:hypothetical protein NX059_006627 [Plenodomus lindquistii]|nr:hypothetical protein NX059_006627 [Plenodomus lindquistii]